MPYVYKNSDGLGPGIARFVLSIVPDISRSQSSNSHVKMRCSTFVNYVFLCGGACSSCGGGGCFVESQDNLPLPEYAKNMKTY